MLGFRPAGDFALSARVHVVGFLSQAPLGTACDARFDRIRFTDAVPADLRDGS